MNDLKGIQIERYLNKLVETMKDVSKSLDRIADEMAIINERNYENKDR